MTSARFGLLLTVTLSLLTVASTTTAVAADAPTPSTVAKGGVLVEVFSSAAFHELPERC